MKDPQILVAEFSKPNANWIELVKFIQKDAWESGIEDAAQVADGFADYDKSRDGRRISRTIRGLREIREYMGDVKID